MGGRAGAWGGGQGGRVGRQGWLAGWLAGQSVQGGSLRGADSAAPTRLSAASPLPVLDGSRTRLSWAQLCSPSGQVVYEWARGTPFRQICELTDVMEGSIVRAMVRLDETCRHVVLGVIRVMMFVWMKHAGMGLAWLSSPVGICPAPRLAGAGGELQATCCPAAARASLPRLPELVFTCIAVPPTHPCREFRDAARVMGNTQLFQQMEKASASIKRDVIFAGGGDGEGCRSLEPVAPA